MINHDARAVWYYLNYFSAQDFVRNPRELRDMYDIVLTLWIMWTTRKLQQRHNGAAAQPSLERG